MLLTEMRFVAGTKDGTVSPPPAATARSACLPTAATQPNMASTTSMEAGMACWLASSIASTLASSLMMS